MVSFSNIRYSEAWKIGQQQEALMQKIMEIPDIETIWDSEEVEQKKCYPLSLEKAHSGISLARRACTSND